MCALFALLLVASCPAAPVQNGAISFTTITEGIEYARLRQNQHFQIPTDGHVFRMDLRKVGLRILPAGGPATRRSVDVIARSLPEVVAANASFFDKQDRAMGMVVDQGRTISKRIISAWGALVVQDGNASILPGKALSSLPSAKLDLVVQGTPRWVIDGVVPKLKSQAAQRTAVCAHQHVVLLVIATLPVEAEAFAHFLARPRAQGGLACEQALNLDGGPSTQLAARIGDIRVDVPGGFGVPNALVALPGLPARASAPASQQKRSSPLPEKSVMQSVAAGE